MRSTPISFWDWFTSRDTGDLAGLSILVVLGGVAVIIVLSSVVYLMHKNRLQDSLKRELLDRGFSADELATIVYGKRHGKLEIPKLTDAFSKVQVK
jgi:hypothetical protein